MTQKDITSVVVFTPQLAKGAVLGLWTQKFDTLGRSTSFGRKKKSEMFGPILVLLPRGPSKKLKILGKKVTFKGHGISNCSIFAVSHAFSMFFDVLKRA